MKKAISIMVAMLISGAAVGQTTDQDTAQVNSTDTDITGDGNNTSNQQTNTSQQLNNNTTTHVETRPTENSNIGSSSGSSSNNSLANFGNASVSVEGDDFAASSAVAPHINPTSPCMGSSSAGGQGMSFGISVGSSWRDKECEKREAFRMGMQSGHPEITALALEVYRNLDIVQEALNPAQAAEEARAGRPNVSAYAKTLAGAQRTLP